MVLHRPFRLASVTSRVSETKRARFSCWPRPYFSHAAAHDDFPPGARFLKHVYNASSALGVALGVLLSNMEPVGLETTAVASTCDGELTTRPARQGERGAVYVLCRRAHAGARRARTTAGRAAVACALSTTTATGCVRAAKERTGSSCCTSALRLRRTLARRGGRPLTSMADSPLGSQPQASAVAQPGLDTSFTVMALANVTNKELEERAKDAATGHRDGDGRVLYCGPSLARIRPASTTVTFSPPSLYPISAVHPRFMLAARPAERSCVAARTQK